MQSKRNADTRLNFKCFQLQILVNRHYTLLAVITENMQQNGCKNAKNTWVYFEARSTRSALRRTTQHLSQICLINSIARWMKLLSVRVTSADEVTFSFSLCLLAGLCKDRFSQSSMERWHVHGPRKNPRDFGGNPDHVTLGLRSGRVKVMVDVSRHTRQDCYG